jgi:DHA2 family multidrug resistance protein
MMATFGVSIDKIEWVMTAYLMAFAVVLPSSGWIADRFGHKLTYILGLILFTVGSMACSFSQNESFLIAFRVFQGVGAGFLTPVGIIGIIAVVVLQDEYKSHIKEKFDIGGFITMSIGLGALLLAFSTGNSSWNTGGWHSTFIFTNFFIAAVCLIAFITIEMNKKHPILNLKILKYHNFGLATLILFIFGVAFFGNSFLLPLFLQNSLGYTAFQAGLVFLPVGILQAFVAPLSGQFTDRFNPKIPLFTGAIILGITMYLFSFFSLQTMHGQIMLPLYLRGLGMGLFFAPLSAIALNDIPRPQLAQASSLFTTVRQIGGSFGIAALGTILTERVKFHAQIYSEQLRQGSPQYNQVMDHLKNFAMHATGSSSINGQHYAKMMLLNNIKSQAYVQGINDDFLIGAVLTFSLLIPMLLLKTRKKKLNR